MRARRPAGRSSAKANRCARRHAPGRARNGPPAGATAMLLAGERNEPLPDRARGRLRRLAVQIAARRGGGRRGVGHLAGVGRGDAHLARAATLQFLGDDLRDLGVQALAHLRAAVIDQHACRRCRRAPARRPGCRCVALNEMPNLTGVSAMPRLITGLAALNRAISAAPLAVVAARLELVDDAMDDVVLDRLAVVRDVALGDAVEVDAAHVERIRPSVRAMSSITASITIMPCGPPKPRNAVFETVLVLQRCETISTCSRK